MTAKMVELVMTDQTRGCIYTKIPVKYLQTHNQFKHTNYHWSGEKKLEELSKSSHVVTIDAYAYSQRHQKHGYSIQIRTGGYPDRANPDNLIHFKVMGIVEDNKLFVITQKAPGKFEDIAPRSPVRIASVYGGYAKIKTSTKKSRFSSPQLLLNIT